MDLDAKVCYCFHITRRKLVNFVRAAPAQGAEPAFRVRRRGPGCGWCIPFLKQIHAQADADLEVLTPEEYAAKRAEYIRAGHGKPPPGATPLPECEK